MIRRLLLLIICTTTLLLGVVSNTTVVLAKHGVPEFCPLVLGEFCLISDLSSYHLGDTVVIRGFVPQVNPNQFVNIQVYNPRDEIFFSSSIPPSPDGWFNASFHLEGEGAVHGLWKVSGFYGALSTQHTFEVETDFVPPTVVTGIVLPTPKFMEDEIGQYVKEIADTRIPKDFFLMIGREGLYLVLSDEVPGKGVAVVNGKQMKDFRWKDYTFLVLKANSINVQTEGEPTTISEIRNDPAQYHLRLVKISGELQRISAVLSAFGRDVQLGFTTVEGKPTTELAKVARDFVKNPTEQEVTRLLGITEHTSFILNTGTLFWAGSIFGDVHAVVVVPGLVGKDAQRFIGDLSRSSELTKKTRFFLYEVKTDIDAIELRDVKDVIDNLANLKGKAVSLTVNAQGATMSIRELLRLVTGGELPADVVFHGLSAWTNSPEEAKIRMYGFSSHIQKELWERDSGLFEIKARVVTGKMIDSRLPDIPALHILEMQKVSAPTVMSLEEQEIIDVETSVIQSELETVITQVEESSIAEDVSAKDTYHVAQIGFDKDVYRADERAVIRVIDPDADLDPNLIDTVEIRLWSTTDTKGMLLTLKETAASTGVFEEVISFTTTAKSSQARPLLRISEGDVVTLAYTDTTLPAPLSAKELYANAIIETTKAISESEKEIRVMAKHTKRMTMLSVQNYAEEDISAVKLHAFDGSIKYVKARGWDGERIDPSTVMVSTDDRPIPMLGRLIILMILDNPNTSIEWSVFDGTKSEVGRGVALRR